MARKKPVKDTDDQILDPEKITSKQRVQLARRGRAERMGGLGTGTRGIGTGLRQNISSILGAAAEKVASNPLVPVVNPQKFRGMRLDPRTMGGKSYQSFAELEEDIGMGERPETTVSTPTESDPGIPLPPPGVVEPDANRFVPVAPPTDPTATYDPNTDTGLYTGPMDPDVQTDLTPMPAPEPEVPQAPAPQAPAAPAPVAKVQPIGMREDKGIDTGTGSYTREGTQSPAEAADEYYGRASGGTGMGEDAAAAMQAQNMATEEQKTLGSEITSGFGLSPTSVLKSAATGAITGGVPGAVSGVMGGLLSPLGILSGINTAGGAIRSYSQAGDVMDQFEDQGLMQHADDPAAVKTAAKEAATVGGGLAGSLLTDALSGDPRIDSTAQLAEMAGRKEVASQYGYELQPGDAGYEDIMTKSPQTIGDTLKTALLGGPAPTAPQEKVEVPGTSEPTAEPAPTAPVAPTGLQPGTMQQLTPMQRMMQLRSGGGETTPTTQETTSPQADFAGITQDIERQTVERDSTPLQAEATAQAELEASRTPEETKAGIQQTLEAQIAGLKTKYSSMSSKLRDNQGSGILSSIQTLQEQLAESRGFDSYAQMMTTPTMTPGSGEYSPYGTSGQDKLIEDQQLKNAMRGYGGGEGSTGGSYSGGGGFGDRTSSGGYGGMGGM